MHDKDPLRAGVVGGPQLPQGVQAHTCPYFCTQPLQPLSCISLTTPEHASEIDLQASGRLLGQRWSCPFVLAACWMRGICLCISCAAKAHVIKP